MSILLRSVFFSCVLLAANATWKVLRSSPVTFTAGTAHAFDNEAFFFGINQAYKYTVSADTWANINTSPTPRRSSRVEENPLHSGRIMVVGGWNPAGGQRFDENEEYSVAQDAWESKALFPAEVSSLCCATVSSHVAIVCVGGDLPSVPPGSRINHVYSFNADDWTTKASCPSINKNSGSASDGILFYTIGHPSHTGLVEVYNLAADAWTTKTSSPNSGVSGDGLEFSSLDSSLYQIIGNGFAQYTIAAASIVGDPVVTSLSGSVHHLSLFPGVFNLFSSPSLVVNAAVDSLSTLPPGEDMVVTLVGIVAELPDGSVAVLDCAVDRDINEVVCRTRALEYAFSPAASIHSVGVMSSDAFDVVLPYWTLHIAFNKVAVTTVSLSTGVVTVGQPSCWMDVHLRPSLSASGEAQQLQGMLVSPSRAPVHFEVASGCLYDVAMANVSASTRDAALSIGLC